MGQRRMDVCGRYRHRQLRLLELLEDVDTLNQPPMRATPKNAPSDESDGYIAEGLRVVR